MLFDIDLVTGPKRDFIKQQNYNKHQKKNFLLPSLTQKQKMTQLIVWLVITLIVWWFLTSNKEAFGTSPGVFDQLASSSGYYPYWRYGYGYNWPYYRYIYPYPEYSSYRRYPRPWGWYNWW